MHAADGMLHHLQIENEGFLLHRSKKIAAAERLSGHLCYNLFFEGSLDALVHYGPFGSNTCPDSDGIEALGEFRQICRPCLFQSALTKPSTAPSWPRGRSLRPPPPRPDLRRPRWHRHRCPPTRSPPSSGAHPPWLPQPGPHPRSRSAQLLGDSVTGRHGAARLARVSLHRGVLQHRGHLRHVNEQRPEEAIWDLQLGQEIFTGQPTAEAVWGMFQQHRVPSHQSWDPHADDLPDWEVPRHDSEHRASDPHASLKTSRSPGGLARLQPGDPVAGRSQRTS